MQKTYSVFKIILTLWSIYLQICLVQCNESCWNNDNECNIKTELFKDTEFSNGISMQIDCRLNFEDNNQKQIKGQEHDLELSTKNLFIPRLMDIKSVMLDGCQTPLNARTFGLELLPICANITKAAIRHFHMDTLKPLYCKDKTQQLQIESLNVQFNEITFIDGGSFPPNYTNLRDILIEKNLLKLISKDAFRTINSLENLYIVNEPVLMLKFPDLFEYSSFWNIHLETLKQMTSEIFQRLPETLQNLYVANTKLEDNTVFVRNSLVLKNLTLKNCALRNFTLRDVHSTVKSIDLSGNVMENFTAYENCLKELNFNNNKLTALPLKSLENLKNLEYLFLKGNLIKILSLNELLRVVPSGKLLDFSQNQLKNLQDYTDNIQDTQLAQVRLNCDQNPWDCLWLLDFAHYHPEKFRILQYEKFISKINVNGLECMPTEKAVKTANKSKPNLGITMDRIVNVSTYTLMYGSPWEIKRNQRAEALIIVFMLPLGIACLFVLLYMWIYCQKMFHISYYQNFPCLRRSDNHNSQRFDIIRQIPPRPNHQTEPRIPLTRIVDDNEDGYEMPINGIISECNCLSQQNDEESERCQKAIHITYEHLPNDESSPQIYEEIIQVEGQEDSAVKAKQTYDHLSFN